MLGPRQEMPSFQSDFYRDQYRKTLRWLLGAIFVILVLAALIIYLIFSKPTPRYYANTTDGKILPMWPAR